MHCVTDLPTRVCYSRSGVTAQEAQRRSAHGSSSHSHSSDSGASGAARSNNGDQRAKQSRSAAAAVSEQRLSGEQVPAGVRPPANNDGN